MIGGFSFAKRSLQNVKIAVLVKDIKLFKLFILLYFKHLIFIAFKKKIESRLSSFVQSTINEL